MLCVPLASPPVPQVSMAPSGARTLTARSRMARAAPVISSMVSPRARSAHQQRADLRVGCAARHDQREGVGGFGLAEGLAWRHLAEDRAEIRKRRRACERGARGHRPLLCGPRRGAPLDAGKVEEVDKQLMAVLRGDALGMELHAVHRIAFVLQAHDHAVGGLGGDLQRVGQALALDHQRMIARGREILRNAGEHALAGVMHFRQLAMHQGRRAHHAAAIDLADGLMAETDAEDRHHRPGACDQLEADAGPVGIAWARRQHDGLGRLGQHLVDGDLVVAVDARRGAQFAEEMDEVVGKAVVIIDQRQHGVVLRLWPAPRQGVRRAARGSSRRANPWAKGTGSASRYSR